MGWWIGLGVLILLAGLLGAACVRAALLKNPEKRGEPQPVDGEKAAKYAKDLSRMIRCETISVRESGPAEKFARYRANFSAGPLSRTLMVSQRIIRDKSFAYFAAFSPSTGCGSPRFSGFFSSAARTQAAPSSPANRMSTPKPIHQPMSFLSLLPRQAGADLFLSLIAARP